MVEREEQKHISVGIEKTAGTSFGRFLVWFYGPDNVLIYKNDSNSLISADNPITLAAQNTVVDKLRSLGGITGILPVTHLAIRFLRNREKRPGNLSLPEKWLVIHGHFKADMFDSVVPNPFRTVVVRDPLERAISHFRYWKRAKGVVNHQFSLQYSSGVSFRDFALSGCMQNFQTKALGSIPLEDFDVVGVTEDLDGFIENVARRRKGKSGKMYQTPHLNKSYGSLDLRDLGIDGEFVRKFKSVNALDYNNYQKAKKLCTSDST
jgi:hypothetical protein